MTDIFINLMILQALLGAFDTIYHHEFKVALPRQRHARRELNIHALRAVLYGAFFLGIAWFEWHGNWAWLPFFIILVEIFLTLWDFVIEDQTRLLPASERVTHTLLAINGGAAVAFLAVILLDWHALSTAVSQANYGWRSWFLTLAGIGVSLSGIRDALAAWQTQRLDLQLNLDLGGQHKRILITGGTGFIGSALCFELLTAGHDITVLTRNPVAASIQFGGRVRALKSTASLSDDEHFDVVINLAGAPVVGPPWTAARKKVLLASRLNPTRDLLGFVKRTTRKPSVWVQASAIGYYGTDSDLCVDESDRAGNGFAARLCQEWEEITTELEALSVRRVVLRFGLVFGRSGGSLPMMLLSFRFGMGSILGTGQQHMSWIHIEDLLRLIAQVIANNDIQGAINAVAPDCPTYQQFAKLAGKQLHRPVWFRIPDRPLRQLLGEMASLFVDGPEIRNTRLQEFKFQYQFPDLRSALMDLV